MCGWMNSFVKKSGYNSVLSTLHRGCCKRRKQRPLFDTPDNFACCFVGNRASFSAVPCKWVLFYPSRYRFHIVSTTIQRSFSSTSASQEATEGQKPVDRAEQIAQAAEALLRKDVGSFQYPFDFDRSNNLIKDLVNGGDCDSGCARSINACIGLWERVVREYSILLELQNNDDTVLRHRTTSETDVLWFCNSFFLNALLTRWKSHAIRHEKVVSPRDIVQKLKTMETLLPTLFRCNIVTMTIVLQAIIGQEPPSKAPLVAERLLEFIEAESSSRSILDDFSMRPTSYTYSIVLQSWSVSGLPNASEKMETIMEAVHRANCSADTPIASIDMVPYSIWIRYWANLGNSGKVDGIFAMIDRNARLQSKFDVGTINDAIFCYTKFGQIRKAEEMFDRMISITVPSTNINPSEKKCIVKAIKLGSFCLLQYYRQAIVKAIGKQRHFDGNTEMIVRHNIERSESVYERTKQLFEVDVLSGATIRGAMMDIYAIARQFDVVETMFHGIKNPGIVEYNILVKAYGKCLRPEHAEEVVRRMIDNPRSPKPNDHTMTSLLNAWAESSAKYGNAAERAYNVFRWFYDDPKVVALQLLPSIFTYTTILKCLAGSDSVNRANDMGQKVEAILKEMESRYISGDTSCKPDEYLCNAAINALLSANDLYRAEALLKRMEQSSHHLSEGKAMEYVQPTARTYNAFLNHLSKMRTTEAVERAEQLLHHMRKLSQLTIPLAKPGEYAYSIVLNAWATCGSPDAGDRMWKIYEEMVHVDKLPLDEAIANVLVKFLSNSKNTIDLSRTLQLLRSVNDYKQIQLRSLMYCQVLHCCMKMNDHKSAVQVMKFLCDACLTGRCRFDVAPNRAQINWLLNRWLAFDQLTEATLFLETLMQISSRTTKTSKLLYLGADYNTALDLRKAWTTSSHPEKQYYIAKMDTEILPAIMHASNFRNGKVRQFGILL